MLTIVLIFITTIFFGGVLNRTKSIFSGRKGPGLFQPVYDILRLLRKGSVYSETTSFIFRIAPSIYFASLVTAALFIPLDGQRGLLSFQGDFILFAYVLALGKFFNIISALDTGSSFEGMGASREALYSMLAEPSFFILMGSVAALTGHTSFADIFASIHYAASASPIISYLLGIVGAFIFFMLGLIENSRVPGDDPKTHLELTMVHEVMILDNSGFDLGLILYAGLIKFAIYGALMANLFITSMYPLYINILIFLGVEAVYAVLTGALESFMARFRINQNPQFIFSLSSIALLVFIAVMILTGKF
jgi:formate hydrogenlyase subunit 4